MGEKVKDVGKLEIKGVSLNIEINEPVDKIKGGIIHIQSDSFRMEMTQMDFYNMAAAVILARKQLTCIKKMD